MAMRVGKAIIKKKGSKGERTEKRDEMDDIDTRYVKK
jgi:hypothetical protein